MSCVGTPTETQFTTSVTTTFNERVVLTTQFVTLSLTSGFRLARRQDPNASTNSDGGTSSSSSSDSFGAQEISSIVGTVTFSDPVVVTNTIPQQTLFAPCTTSNGSTSTSLTGTGTSVTSSDRSTDSSTPPARSNLADSIPHDAKSTTVSEGVTVVVSEYITTVNGIETITQTPIQTLLNTTNNPLSDSQRTGIIVGGTIGGLLALIALLGVVFYFRRARIARNREIEQQQKRQPRHGLEDEDDWLSAPMGQWDSGSLATGSTTSGAPRLLRPRGSQTGSLFHENVWPPPSEVIQDPLLTPDDLGSSISLAIGLPLDQSMPTAVTSSEAVGAGRQQRVASSTYESLRSLDTADYDRYHSRSDSIDPLLIDQNTAGRTMSMSPPPPSSMRPTSPPNPAMKARSTRSNLRVSYTADDVEAPPQVSWSPQPRSGTRQSLYSLASIPRHELSSSPTSVMPNSAGTENSELARDVFLAEARAGMTDSQTQDIPTIKRTFRDSQ